MLINRFLARNISDLGMYDLGNSSVITQGKKAV
jgi:hypothetical protein